MNEVEDLAERLENINISANMEAIKERRDVFLQNVKLLQPFDGNKSYLALFVDSVSAMIPSEATQLEERRFYYNCIKTTLRGPALDVLRREQPTDWITLKQLLIEEFGERTPVTRLILEISNIKFNKNVKEFCDKLNSEVCKIKDEIRLKTEDISTRNFLSTELNRVCLSQLKKELPNYLTALINANLAKDLKTAIKILAENGELNSTTPQRTYVRNKNYGYQSNNKPQVRHFQTGQGSDNYLSNTYPPNYSGNYTNPYMQSIRSGNHPQNNFNCPNPNYPQYNYAYRNLNGQGGYDSTQSRIRRYGPPVPMEVDPENFHARASGHYRR